ncbi:MAG: response regulator transcription factor [Polyangiales bacterium]
MRVLLIEDHAETRELVARALTRDAHAVTAVATAHDARMTVRDKDFDVLVVDLGLPDGDGLALCEALRREGCEAPILVLTAQGAIARRVECLDAGVDDFLAKPFAVAELRARVRALGRRGPMPRGLTLRAGDVSLEVSARRATRGGEPVPLTAREWAVLELLALRAGRVVSREAILDAIWDEPSERAGASLDVILARVRKKLGDGVVRTLRGEGYTLEAT